MSKKLYTIALDDFTYREELKPLIEIADIIKFDFRSTSKEQIYRYLSHIPQREGLRLLAEKAETYEEFDAARKMGFAFLKLPEEKLPDIYLEACRWSHMLLGTGE